MEMLDLFDKNRNPLNKKVGRYETLEDGVGYYQIVNIIILNNKNEILISKRSETKRTNKLKWECCGGAVSSGETPLEAALREVKEELGILLDEKKGKLFLSFREEEKARFRDVFVFYQDVDIDDIVFTDNEVCDAKYVNIDEFKKIYESGEMLRSHTFVIDNYARLINERIK